MQSNAERSIFCQNRFSDDELFSAVAQALARSAEDWRQRGEVVASRARLAKLTPREFAVFRLVIGGLLNKEIGAELGVTLRTIKTHRARRRWVVISVAELVRVSAEGGHRNCAPRACLRYHSRCAHNNVDSDRHFDASTCRSHVPKA